MFSRENYAIADGIKQENPHMVNGKVVRFEYDDGRHYISTSDQKFDIISADPIDPWAKGAAALYSVEYFKICKAHLKPGGAMSLWVPLYETSLNSVRSVISTFFSVFPNGTIWSNDYNGLGYDIVLFGQDEQTHIDIGKLEKRLSREDHKLARQSLADVGFNRLKDLLGTYAGCAADLKGWMTGAQINTDRNLRLSYLSGMSINYSMAPEILQGICQFYQSPRNLFSGSDQKVDSLLLTIESKIILIQGSPY
jgi:spermidine synthase